MTRVLILFSKPVPYILDTQVKFVSIFLAFCLFLSICILEMLQCIGGIIPRVPHPERMHESVPVISYTINSLCGTNDPCTTQSSTTGK